MIHQDAQELLQTVLAMVGDEEKVRKSHANKTRPFSLSSYAVDDSLKTEPNSSSKVDMKDSISRREIDSSNTYGLLRHSTQQRNPHSNIGNPFQGWLASDLVCKICEKQRPVRHQLFTDISLPLESVKITNTTSSPGVNEAALNGGLNCNINVGPKNGIFQPWSLNLDYCLKNFMKDEELQQEVECQNCSLHETTEYLERKIFSRSCDSIIESFRGQHDEQRQDEALVQKLKEANSTGESDSCLFDIDDLHIATEDSDYNDNNSIDDISISTTPSDSCASSSSSLYRNYATWGGINHLGSVISFDNKSKSTPLDPYLVQKLRTRARKQLFFSRPPVLLCLHICRRVADFSSNRMKKLNHHVNFSVELNIKDFMKSHVKLRNPIEYLLRSVIVHRGSAESGHYSTFCLMSLLPRRWMYFSDEEVRCVKEDEVLSSQAYMLFYERKALS